MKRKSTHEDVFEEGRFFTGFHWNSHASSEAERMLSLCFNGAHVGLAIIDARLRYRMVNPYLAASHNASVESHVGKHLREILGNLASQVEPAVRQALVSLRPIVNYRISGSLPTRPDKARWICTYFPVADSNGNVRQVGALVVELGRDIQFHPLHEVGSPATVLRSWKDIAQYVGVSVKTVQRWELAHEFPIHRVKPNKGSIVFGYQNEVEDWLRERSSDTEHFRRR
ncbi:MAG: PAS domain-containing protein [Acidobacteria bacterium]|nr:PAS domain-containing protein [Acidobacteriota bacterium]MBV8892367.1 PAS domain-containing protein [Acidobacteriota bacterium]